MGNDELRERLTRPRGAVEGLPGATGHLPGEVPSVAGAMQVATPLTFKALSKLPDAVVGVRIDGTLDARPDAEAPMKATLGRTAEQRSEGLRLLTPEEPEALADIEADEGCDPGPPGYLAGMAELLADIYRAASETREILSGRFHRPGGRGRPGLIRGRHLSAHLVGAAEGSGLRPSRNRAPMRRFARSAADAVLAALARCSDTKDPIERAMLAECPQTFEVIEVCLLPAIRPGGRPAVDLGA